MKNIRLFVLLTLLTIASAVLAIVYLDKTILSAYGSILAAASGFIAVIWFTGSLWYQAEQLKEQRSQFEKQFIKSHEEGRRNALLLARDILKEAETRTLRVNPNILSLSDLFPLYVNFSEFKDIMESEDPLIVQEAVKAWNLKEGAAMSLMNGIKSAAQVYFVAIGKEDIDYSKSSADFVYIYGDHLWNLPFFESLQGVAGMLTEFMVRLEPARTMVPLAIFGATSKLGFSNILKIDSIKEDMAARRKKGYPIPKIAEKL